MYLKEVDALLSPYFILIENQILKRKMGRTFILRVYALRELGGENDISKGAD
jgi:hypothetical protein